VADNGALGLAVHDSQHHYRLFDYELHRLANGHVRPDPEESGDFALEVVRRLEFAPFPQFALAIADKDLWHARLSPNGCDLQPYMQGRGLVFLDTAAAGSDPRATVAIVWQDRAAGTFNLGVAEARDKLAPLWAKSWSRSLTALAISADGNWIAVGHTNGGITLLDRNRRTVWDYAGGAGRMLSGLAVDIKGGLVVVDSTGEIRRHDAREGAVVWRGWLENAAGELPAAARPSYRIASDNATRVVAVSASPPAGQQGDAEPSRYYVLDGATGEIAWEDTLDSRSSGVAVSPSGTYLAISTHASALLFSVTLGATPAHVVPRPAVPGLVEKAKEAVAGGQFFEAHPLLLEALEADPTDLDAATLFEELRWHIRETVLERTTQSTEESLALAEKALQFLPHNEKLTARRNALARILAGKLCEEAQSLVRADRCEIAIQCYHRALALDPGLIEARQAILKVKERLVGRLVQEAQAAAANENWEESKGLMEQASQICPDDPQISDRLAKVDRDEAFALAISYQEAQRFPEAAFQLKRVLALDPSHMDALLRLNEIEARLRRPAAPDDPVGVAIERFNHPH
jgi:hypothetical protein